MKLHDVAEVLEVTKSNLSSSTFSDVNLANVSVVNANLSSGVIRHCNMIEVSISDANLNGVKIAGCSLDGMTINGVPVTEMLAAYWAIREIQAGSANA